MNIIVKIAIISSVFIILSLLLKSYRPEFVFLLRIFFVVLLASLIIDYVSKLISDIISIFTAFNINSEHISLLFKVIAITIVSDFVSDSLNETGESSVANVIILISKIIILFMIMPLLNSLIIFCLKFIT